MCKTPSEQIFPYQRARLEVKRLKKENHDLGSLLDIARSDLSQCELRRTQQDDRISNIFEFFIENIHYSSTMDWYYFKPKDKYTILEKILEGGQ